MSQIHCIVSGRVQLVMYRDFAQRKARKLGVLGTVLNLRDGTVEVNAVADKVVLEKYISLLKKGPILSRVDNVKVEWLDDNNIYEDFVILYN